MKNKDLKSDVVAGYIVSAFSYIIKNKISFLIIIAGISVSIWYFNPPEIPQDDINASRQASDKIALDNILNSEKEDNEANYDSSIVELDTIHKSNNYYKLSTSSDSLFMEFSHLIEKINNKTLKTLYLLKEGDINSNNAKYSSAKSSYKSAINSSESDALKGYANYKIGIIYLELKEFDSALSSFQEAAELFDKSKNNTALSNNQQFSAWVSRNNIALAQVKNILKK